ncbi:MBL fold metallo-hydrolase RNA specificity domain-containing protein [Moritella viscosa]|uniref:RNAse with metallo-beta-lactamase-like domain n=1 Tax=Moritella viscosa TaxID=80854 RepID=A0ABY1HEM8_9GAMM|nr:MBL fold metallo-hydrolase [Moritella viscosa]CED61657.1 putative RNA-metabolising metallo-beta-lactamase [Moritella viscosa]SGY90114.1 Putative RNAse with metallo-beta-lactamase-like domain [Moritella viscosa]SGY99075.1 Putative RNAse with metallo-beta-lactamase-like domain [Moritella viscosa]SHO06239.1 Putative RNAse with metallo-beta-lactamase-like domain [Moritella viscosa]SHO21631.1 Putative RNAse with metallo-beta-lactamase-like domain [Moritella viscosa]
MRILHHGAVNGVTGSCHQLYMNEYNSVLIDCGLFQGSEAAGNNNKDQHSIDFNVRTVKALIITHCHIDHVGRIPYLLAAGFTGPIYATEATAALLPLVIEDALKVGVTHDKKLIQACLSLLEKQLIPVPYQKWCTIDVLKIPKEDISVDEVCYQRQKIRFCPAGHILGSAYVEIELATDKPIRRHRVVFSGDLGASYSPLLSSPRSPYRADTLIIESTYGDKRHEHRNERSQKLQAVIEHAVSDNGVVLIPAFSIGRTQELLYEIEQFIHSAPEMSVWKSIEIIVDSPMAANFTSKYRDFKSLWDKEALGKLKQGRHPLNFDQLYTIDSHQDHLTVVKYLARRNKPVIVIAASGMCSSGRIVNYLTQFLPDAKADVIFVGYQAQGTAGRDIQQYGPRGGYVDLNGKRITINASIHTISGYSAHADQQDLLNFVKHIKHKPQEIRIVHGDEVAKAVFGDKLGKLVPDSLILLPNQ